MEILGKYFLAVTEKKQSEEMSDQSYQKIILGGVWKNVFCSLRVLGVQI